MRVVGGRWSVVGGVFEPLMGAEGADCAEIIGGLRTRPTYLNIEYRISNKEC